MMQQHSSLDSKEESYKTVFFCTCCFIPYWNCNGKNKLARHLLAMSVVCFYACNDTLNSVVDSPPPSPPYVPFQGSSASKIVWMSARFVFFVCFGPRSGLRCGGILWSDNSFHVPSLRCARARVFVCVLPLLAWQSSGSANSGDGWQASSVASRPAGGEPFCPVREHPVALAWPAAFSQWELLLAEAWRRRKCWQSLTHHWQRTHRHSITQAWVKIKGLCLWNCKKKRKGNKSYFYLQM